VAEAIGGDLDVVVARKIGFPGHAELAMGAVCEEGPPVFNDTVLAQAGLTADELAGLVEAERHEARRRMRRYRGDRPPPPIAGRLVIVVDDGLATGATARAALRSVRSQHPARLVFAAPVCAPDAPAILRDADDVLCVTAPEQLIAVGRWYDRFEQLTDAEVDHHLAVAHHAA
jgi:putative phosphoribosyl transferase